MKILVFHQYYETPDCAGSGRHYAFYLEWAKRHEVTVISTDALLRRRTTKAFPLAPPGVTLIPFEIEYDNRMSIRQRLPAFGKYALKAWHTGRKLERPDIIFGTSTPLSAAWAAARVAQAHRVPWVFEVRDLWPDFPVQMGALRNPLARNALYRLERRLYHDAAHVVALSPDMASHVEAKGVPANRVTTVVNGTSFDLSERWTSKDSQRIRSETGIGSRRVILYAGTLGRANAIPTLIETARRFGDRDDVALVFVGYGYHRESVEQLAKQQQNVWWMPAESKWKAYRWFELADVAIVPFIDRPVLASNSPIKFFDALGAGTPVVVTNPGWTARLVTTERLGRVVPPEAPAALASALTDLLSLSQDQYAALSTRCHTYARTHFDRTTLAKTVESILKTTASKPRPH
ncbi:MAG: glycosyltransferase family 4 protein [Bacteroidota bacterium]